MTDIFKKYEKSNRWFDVITHGGNRFTARVLGYNVPIGGNALWYIIEIGNGVDKYFRGNYMPDGEALTSGFYDIVETEDSKFMLDNINIGDVAILSDGSQRIVKYVGTYTKLFQMKGDRIYFYGLRFEDGSEIKDLNPDGSSAFEDGIYVQTFTAPPEKVDLSTITFGDTLIARDGYEIPWRDLIDLKDGSPCPFLYINKEHKVVFVSPSGFYIEKGKPNGNDIVSIRRATKEEKAALAEKLMKE